MENNCIIKLIEVNGNDYSIAKTYAHSNNWDIDNELKMLDSNSMKNMFLKNYIKNILIERKICFFKEVELLFYIRIPVYIKNKWISSIYDCTSLYPKGYNFEYFDSDLVRNFVDWPICNDNELLAQELANECNKSCEASFNTYYSLIKKGMTGAQAQKVLPLASWTETHWKTNVYDILKFMAKYFNNNTQIEIYSVFELIEECLSEYFILTLRAWYELSKKEQMNI